MIEKFAEERNQVADDWARYTAERLQKSLLRHKIGKSGSLSYSIIYALKSISGGEVGSIRHEFNYYGKFVDMGVGRGQKIEDVKGNRDMVALMGSGRRPKKWFSKSYYAEVMQLEEILAKKYGQQYQRLIKETIQGNY